MSTVVFLMVILAAFTHATWNYFSKKVNGDFTIFWYGCSFAVIILLIYTVFSIITTGFDFDGIPYILISVISHAIYYLAFLYTYSRGDISSAYPIARGTGVAGTAVVSYFVLGASISTIATIGIFTVIGGIVFIGASRSGKNRMDTKTFLASLLAGICIFIYSIADSKGVQYVNPIVYICLVDLLAYSLLAKKANKNGIRKSFNYAKKYIKEAIIIGVGSSGTYIIILFAMRMSEASYIVAMREFSVVIASILGFVFFKEKPTIFKIIGIVLITAGLFIIKAG